MNNQPAPGSSGGPPAQGGGFDMNRPTIVSLLYVLSFATGITGIIGVIMAYIWRGEMHEPWLESHYTYLIRTFWIGLLASIVAGVLSLVFIGMLLFPVIAVWFGVRSVLSLVKAQKREPMPDPETLWF
ncbi:MAG: hypothetical protein EP341_04240 [Sphingomonadales bacterium]|nr:MAG: hypothetical protein EP341_04240 [Sphingomonadales bacterium]